MEAMDFTKVVCTRQQRIAELARIHRELSFTSLAHHMDMAWLKEAYDRTRKDGAVGVDRQTADEYAQDLKANLASLLERAKSGRYKAPPVRRVYIPKAGSSTEKRPIGIPTFEDKVLQRAVQMILEPLYEQDFLDCSYGFRPGRGAHQALEALWHHLMRMGGGWVIDLDVRKFFDTLSHSHLREILATRVSDGVLTRLVGKWLKAGVWEKGSVSYPETGSPQGGVISPMLSNVYLHEVLDKWFVKVATPRLRGRGHLVRYADDAVLVFEKEEDARRVMEVLPKRFEKYGLSIHPEKTRLIRFERPDRRQGGEESDSGGESFSFLGFTHVWARTRKGRWVVQKRTDRTRLGRALKAVSQWCRRNRHRSIAEQQRILTLKLRGHYSYYGVTGNSRALGNYFYQVRRIWHKWLGRRSRAQPMPWDRFEQLLARYPIPLPRVVHSVYLAKP